MQYKVKELTVKEIRQWQLDLVAAESSGDSNAIDFLLFVDEGMGMFDIPYFTDLTTEQLEQMTPSQISNIIKEINEKNVHFSKMRKYLTAAVQERMAKN